MATLADQAGDWARVSAEAGSEPEARLCVLKFGSSVLGTEADYPAVALEIYRHVRAGEKVVAVVSALAGQTDALLDALILKFEPK